MVWEDGLKGQIKAFGKGWGIREHDGMFRIHHRPGGQQKAAPLGLRWHENNSGEAYLRAVEIRKLVQNGYPIKEAAKKAAGESTTTEEDWKGALKRFKDQKLNHRNAIVQKTWDHDYLPVLEMALKLLLSNKAPTNPADLLDLCLREWKSGSRTRQQRARSLCQFLKHCVVREHFPSNWIPPIDLKSHIGRKPANAKTQKVAPLTDQEILLLIDSIPKDPPGLRWADALRLMAVYGLRPTELLYLEVKNDGKTGELYLWCSYEKRSGGGITKPRRLEPLILEGQEWNLLMRLKGGMLKLPPLESKNGAGEAARKYLERRPVWISLSKALKARGENIGTYSFRHSYSVRGHQLNVDGGSLASAMGHSYETHCRAYPWATSGTTALAFKKAREVAIAKQA